MRRILMITVVTLSVLATSAMLALWVRSIGRVEGIQWSRARLKGRTLNHRVIIIRHYSGIAYLGLTRNLDDNSYQPAEWNSLGHYTLTDAEHRTVHSFWKRRIGFDHFSNGRGGESYILA